jgi:hypothetical protein
MNVVVGFGWDGCDEGKMMETFGFGRKAMSRFLDLQTICAKLGYGNNMGLGKLTQQVMGITIPKDKKVTPTSPLNIFPHCLIPLTCSASAPYPLPSAEQPTSNTG